MTTTILLTLKLAAVTTVILMILGTPLAWWLAKTRLPGRSFIEALVALPLVLPPTVLGFYLLVLFDPTRPLGQFFVQVTGHSLAFHFSGLVVASVIYSLPFVVQPLQSAFVRLPDGLLETARVFGAHTLDLWVNVIFPSCRRAFLAAATLAFAHTLGEFGVVLMIGGAIPGETLVLSIALFDAVETLDLETAHRISAILLVFSLLLLTLVYRSSYGFKIRPSAVSE